METPSLLEKRACPCGIVFPEGTAANRRYCNECHRQRNRDYWTRYSHSREPISSLCTGGCGTTLIFHHNKMGRPPKYCETCRSTIHQERRKGKQRQKEEPEIQPIELSHDAEQSLLTAFHRLPDVAQRALTYWIENVIQPANSIGTRDSRHLRRDYSSEAFQVSDEAFKGAMLKCGYRPVNGGDQDNWKFRIQKKHPDQKERYGMMPGHDPVFARMVDAIDAYWERSSIS